MTLTIKVVKIDLKISVSLPWSKSLKQNVDDKNKTSFLLPNKHTDILFIAFFVAVLHSQTGNFYICFHAEIVEGDELMDTVCFNNFDLGSEMIFSQSLLATFIASVVFFSSKNWLELKIEPP